MSTPTIKVKVFPRPVIKAKMDVRFPGRVDVLSPILLDRSGGNFEFSLDMNAVSDAIGLSFQPLDSDLTAIAALTTTAYGRSLLTLANATALAAEVDSFFLTPAEGNAAYQPLDSDLTAIAALSTTSYGRAFLTLADAAAARTAIGAVIGTNVQAYDADLDALSALSGTNTIYYRSAANTWSAVTIGTNLAFAGGTLSASGASLANPTGSVGLTAVNGVATTAMRSDAAPPIDVGIAPTWTGLHTFGLGLTTSAAATINGALAVNNSGNNSFIVTQSSGTTTGSFRSTAASGPSAGGFFNIFSNDSAPLANGDRLGGLGIGGSFDTSGPNTNATPIAMAGFATENWGSGTTGARLDFQMTPNGSGGRVTAMSLHGSGGLGIGSATDPGTGGLKLAGGLFLGSFTVAALPTGVAAGNTAFATNCRVFNGAGTQEGAGAGTGGLVTYNGSAWKIAGTNVTAVA